MFEAIIFIELFGPQPLEKYCNALANSKNIKDRYAVAVVRRSTVVGHIPCKCPVLSEELFAVKSLVHGVILKIFLKVGWRYLANNLTFSHRADSARTARLVFNIGGFKFGDPWKNSPNRQI